MSTAPRVVQLDWEAFHARVTELQAEHTARPTRQAVARSLAAFERWGVAPPPSFIESHPVAAAAARYGRH